MGTAGRASAALLVMALVLPLSGLVTACDRTGGGTATRPAVPPLAGTAPNGEQQRSGPTVLADARASLARSAAVHVTGSLVLGGSPTDVDLTVLRGGSVSGSFGTTAGAVQAQWGAGRLFVRATGAATGVAVRLGLDPAQLPADSFAELSLAGAPTLAGLSLPQLAAGLLPAGAVAAPGLGSGDVDGVPVVTVSCPALGMTVSVAVTGPVRVLRIAGGVAGPGGIDLGTLTQQPPFTTPGVVSTDPGPEPS